MQQKGFTLIEMLVALSVITIGLVIVLQVFPAGFTIGENSQLETQATLAAQEKVESLLSISFSELTIGSVIESSLPSPFEKFTRTTKISFVDANLQETDVATDLKKIDVVVSWKSPLKVGSNKAEIATLVAEK